MSSTTTSPTPAPTATLLDAEFPWKRSVLILALGLGVVALSVLQGRPKSSSEAGVVMDLPYKIGNYWGSKEDISVAEKLLLPPDTQIERKSYDSLMGEKILCSIVLSGIERRSIHRADICLPGQGWTIYGRSVVPVKLKSGHTLNVMQLLLERDVLIGPGRTHKIRSVYYYWFVGRKITTPEHWIRVFYSSWDLLAHNINHRWAYVIVTSVVGDTVQRDGKTMEQTQEMLQDFIRDAVPRFQYSEMTPETLRQVELTSPKP